MTGPNRQAATTEEVQIDIRTTAATGEALIRSIELMFAQAARYQAGPVLNLNPVYIRYKENAAATQYQSEILEGTVERDAWHLGPNRQGDTLIVTLFYTRLNFWETSADVQLALVNGNEGTPGTPTTSALPVFNCGDGVGTTPAEQRDWVQIAAAAITGDLPAPFRLEFENETTVGVLNRYHWYGVAIWPDPDSLTHILEGEGADGATPVAQAANSGGNYANYTLTGTETAAFNWTFTDGQMEAFGGAWYMPFIRMRVGTLPASATTARLQLIYQTLVLWQHDYVTTLDTAKNLQALPPIQIPPATLGADLNALTLRLTLKRAALGTFSLDYLKLMPMDGFRQLVPRTDYGLAKDETLVDDNISRPERQYVLTGADKVAQYYPKGQYANDPPMLWPGQLTRVFFAWDSTDGTAATAKTAGIKLWWRPRRRTL